MEVSWKSFIQSEGGEFKDGTLLSFGNPEQERHIASSGDLFSDLSHLALLEVGGEESASFLQNQLTNDIAALKIGDSQLDGWCTPKGRMLALFLVVRTDESKFLLQFPIELLEMVKKRMQMFIMRSKVTLTNLSNSLICIGVSGPTATKQLTNFTLSSGEQPTVVSLQAGAFPRAFAISTIQNAPQLWEHLNVKSAPVGSRVWELTNIRAAVPTVVAATQESFIPQMLNLQNINGLSFTKGCYPGQEVVARMEYLGELKRKPYRITILEDITPSSGDRLYSKSSTSGQGAGEIISIEKDGDGVWEGLTVLAVKVAEADDLTYAEDGSISVKVIQPL